MKKNKNKDKLKLKLNQETLRSLTEPVKTSGGQENPTDIWCSYTCGCSFFYKCY